MKSVRIVAALFLAMLAATPAGAKIITFDASGGGVSGYIQFDVALSGSLDFVPNTLITGFSMTVLGQSFDLGDVDRSAYTLFVSSGIEPVILNGAGGLADNGTLRIFFYPDGANGTPSDGDAALAYFLPDFSVAVLPVRWTPRSVPEPSSLLLLMGGIAALVLRRRTRRPLP